MSLPSTRSTDDQANLPLFKATLMAQAAESGGVGWLRGCRGTTFDRVHPVRISFGGCGAAE